MNVLLFIRKPVAQIKRKIPRTKRLCLSGYTFLFPDKCLLILVIRPRRSPQPIDKTFHQTESFFSRETEMRDDNDRPESSGWREAAKMTATMMHSLARVQQTPESSLGAVYGHIKRC